VANGTEMKNRPTGNAAPGMLVCYKRFLARSTSVREHAATTGEVVRGENP